MECLDIKTLEMKLYGRCHAHLDLRHKREIGYVITTFYYITQLGGATFNKQYEPYEDDYLKNFNKRDKQGKYWLRNGKKRRLGKGYALGSNWVDIHSMQTQSVSRKESLDYPTQKPLKLLERIIKASSKNGHELHLPTL